MRPGLLSMVACLLLVACGDDVGKSVSDAVQDAVSPTRDGHGPGEDAPAQPVQHKLTCSDEWQHCHQVGQTWPQSYPELTPDEAYQLALRWTMCVSVLPDSLPYFYKCSLGTCLSYDMPAVDAPSMACILAAEDCNEVRCCWGIDSGSACANEDVELAHCDGNVKVENWPIKVAEGKEVNLVRRWDCAWSSNNPICLMTTPQEDVDIPAPICGTGTCAVGSDATCDGDVLVLCIDGVERRVDCVERGRICAPQATDGDGDEAACVLATQCLLPHCDEGVAVYCAGGNEVMRIDCNELGPGYVCQDGEVDTEEMVWKGGCAKPDAICDEDDDADFCDGDTVNFCTPEGTWLSFDCSAFANGTCAAVPEAMPSGGPDQPVVNRATCIEGAT